MNTSTAKPRKGLTDNFKELWAGFAEASRLGLASTAVCFLVMTAIALWFFSEATLSGPMGKYVARSLRDSEGFATQQALELGRTPPRHPRLIILGTSATANALAEEQPLAAELQRLTGETWEVHMLTTALQSPLDQMALIENALGKNQGREFPVVVAIGTSMLRQSWATDKMLEVDQDGRLGLRSDWADETVTALGGTPRARIGFYPFDNYRFVATRMAEAMFRLFLQRPAPHRLNIYAPVNSVPVEKRLRALIEGRIRAGLADNTAYLRVLTALRGYLSREPRVYAVQIEEPISPGFLASAGLEEEQRQVTAQFAKLGQELAMPFLPIVTESSIADAAYHDDLHVYDAGAQAAIRRTFASQLAQLITEGKFK